jgi:hypothetical protein
MVLLEDFPIFRWLLLFFLRAVAVWGVILVEGSVLCCLCGGFDVLLGFCLAILFDN